MNRHRMLFSLALSLSLIALIIGCDKERIVESTEIIHDIEYIELPPDTVLIRDTIIRYDSVTISRTDTMVVHDTVIQTNTVYDTIVQVHNVYDTVIVVEVRYDTTVVVDTLVQASFAANELLAIGALQFHVDPLVLDFITQEFGLTDGWIYYLSAWQSEFTRQSEGVYDIYGYVEYWAPDWSGYYPLEYYYRITHTGGDPADPANWQLGEPAASPANSPGLKSVAADKQTTSVRLE